MPTPPSEKTMVERFAQRGESESGRYAATFLRKRRRIQFKLPSLHGVGIGIGIGIAIDPVQAVFLGTSRRDSDTDSDPDLRRVGEYRGALLIRERRAPRGGGDRDRRASGAAAPTPDRRPTAGRT